MFSLTILRRLGSGLAALVFAAFLFTSAAFAQTYSPSLTSALAAANPTDGLEVIVTFDGDGPLTTTQRLSLAGVGVTGLYFNELPIAGVVATPGQISAIAGISGVRSLWLNERVYFENEGGTAITGVDKLRNDSNLRNAMGLPYSGKGIGVLVNDSGIDGLHPDLEDNVVQNVAGQTNLQSWSELLPFTPTEDVDNTDIGGGHGTHVAGTVAATGAQSGGKYEGVAPGASLIGYGSGAALFILDTIGAFDYALTHQFEYNIRVVTNSWGSTSQAGMPFNPDDPINVATKKLTDRGVIVVFSAGNSGPGESTISGNYKKAPWIVTVAAGTKQGNLASFSSRGENGGGGTVVINGQTFTWEDRPTVTSPGVDIISARASTSSLQALSATDDAEMIDPAHLAYYTTMSGTSMAAPHVAGIIALMLEADPTLNAYDVKNILQATASNMPSREAWEVGAGYVNAYNAVVATLGLRSDFGATTNYNRDFNSNAILTLGDQFTRSIDFMTVGETGSDTFEVGADITLVSARATVSENTVALVLIDPDGVRYGSSIALPVLGEGIAVSAPGKAGTWTITVRGIGSISGIGLDPLGVTNGTAAPGTIDATIKLIKAGGYDGLDDIDGHAAEAFIQSGVNERYVDGFADGNFRPDDNLTRGELAEYLVMGAGVRQSLPLGGGFTYSVDATLAPFAEAVAAQGAALKDANQFGSGLMTASGSFDASGSVSRTDLAYAFVTALGLEDIAAGYSGDVTVDYEGRRITLSDSDAIPTDRRGYVQLAIDFNILNVSWSMTQGEFDLQPTIHAAFGPDDAVARGAYAVAAVRFADNYVNGFDLEATQVNTKAEVAVAPRQQLDAGLALDVPQTFELNQNYPNPFNPSTSIRFAVPQSGQVRLAVYNVLGQQVQLLHDGAMNAGTHTVTFEAGNLASGVYLYRLEAPGLAITKQMTLMK